MFRRRRLALCLLVLMLPVPVRAASCSCCVLVNRPTFRQSAAEARLIVYGTLANARSEEDAGGPRSVDINISSVLKTDPFLGNNKSLTLIGRYVPVDPKNPPRYLIFCDIWQGKLDPYRGVEVKSAALVDYVRGAMALDRKDHGAALRYFFRHLEHADRDVAADALLEFGRADSRDVLAIAKDLPADRLADWLSQPQLTPDRIHLYATLLGGCGTDRHAQLLRRLLDKDGDRPGLDGLLVGYILLQPEAGMVRLRGMLADTKAPLKTRQETLRALLFLHDFRPERFSRQTTIDLLGILLERGDMSDLAIEEMRKRGYGEAMEEVLAVFGKEGHDYPVVRRAVVRYALSFPKDPRAVAFVQRVRRIDKEMVEDVVESLSFEKPREKR